MKKVIPILPARPEAPPEFDTKHLSVFNEIKKFVNDSAVIKISDEIKYKITKKTKVCFLLLPEWDKSIVPYNISRLVGVSRSAGYETTAVDLNIESWRESKNWPDQTDYWHGSSEWKWTGSNYWKFIHPHIFPLLDRHLQKIVSSNIDVVGFTLYYCNLEISNWFAKELKKRKPNIKIIVGGPQAHQSYWQPIAEFDVIVSGEGEENLLLVLDKIEKQELGEKQEWIRQLDGVRIDLDAVALPDFTWADFSKYQIPNGILLEFSRGCVAKCTFCGETHFWKYRNRQAELVVNQIEFLNRTYGTNIVWFLDSLVNGNLKELRKFSRGIIDKKIKIKWTGYARCDDRMDYDYYKDLADSGCVALSYGIESGSNKVLKDMAKGITVNEIEQNLKDSFAVGINALTNWIHGFPTETYQDFYETLTLIVRNKNYIHSMSPGIGGFVATSDSIVGQNFDRFNLYKTKWEGEWITKDFKNSKLHRLIRQKMLLLVMNEIGKIDGHPKDFYYIRFNSEKDNFIDYEFFDFDIIKADINPLADSFINEIFVILRLLYRWKGSFSLRINFDRNKDWNNFGDRLGCNMEGFVSFEIDDKGNWKTDFNYNFVQEQSWVYHGFEQADSIAAHRARRLAKREFKEEFTWEDLCQDTKIVEKLQHLNFSFKYSNSHIGKW